MKPINGWAAFLASEWLLLAAAAGLAGTSIYIRQVPVFSVSETQALFLLWALFVAVKGVQESGLASGLARRLEDGRLLPVKLVCGSFLLAMVVTNDVALLAIVPLTLSLRTSRKGLLVILEAFAANAGSALTPFGNPQNLFLYWFYGLDPVDFIIAIAPFSLACLALLLAAAVSLRPENDVGQLPSGGASGVGPGAFIHAGLLVVVILTVLRVLPLAFAGLVLIYALAFDRKALGVDYGLLATFLFFFGLTENLKILIGANIEHSHHVFLLSAFSSQIMSNVSAALLFAKSTSQWKALLWGTNVGGFGNLLSSFANLIAYKLYVRHAARHDIAPFTARFIGFGYVMFFATSGLYLALEAWF